VNLKTDFIKGDSHRFGQRVSFLISDETIKKPRNSKIEFLFLDKDSPLKKFKEILGLGFNTTIISVNENESIVENLSPYILDDIEIEKNADEFFKLAGKFLATSTIFGLNDLHAENILFLKRNDIIQIAPIDLEIIFYHFNSSAEACLTPSPKVDNLNCGFTRLLPYKNLNRIKLLTDSFLHSYTSILQQFDIITQIIDHELKACHVRMLLRPTQLYVDFLKSNDERLFKREPIELTEEERIQLDFGDIPYFFSPYNDPENLSYYTTSNDYSPAIHIMRHPSVKRHLKQKELLLTKEFQLKLKVQSLCHILFYLTENLNDKNLEITGIYFICARQKSSLKIEFESNQITLNF
jgi:lantibiotic modifying enzyme